jgi:hypothetical protein
MFLITGNINSQRPARETVPSVFGSKQALFPEENFSSTPFSHFTSNKNTLSYNSTGDYVNSVLLACVPAPGMLNFD